ncbi:hypothetical protein JCM12296A_13290 [Desulfosarcina cetonica]
MISFKYRRMGSKLKGFIELGMRDKTGAHSNLPWIRCGRGMENGTTPFFYRIRWFLLELALLKQGRIKDEA